MWAGNNICNKTDPRAFIYSNYFYGRLRRLHSKDLRRGIKPALSKRLISRPEKGGLRLRSNYPYKRKKIIIIFFYTAVPRLIE
jgi:hypothetical protein